MPEKTPFSSLKARVLNRVSRMAAKKDTAVGEQVSAVGSASVKDNEAADHQISSSDEPAFPRFLDLPGEIQSIIGAKAVLAGPDLFAGVKTLREVSKVSTNHLVANPIVKKIADICVLADYIHEKTYPRNGLPVYKSPPSHYAPLSAQEHVENSVKRWKYHSDKVKFRVVNDVLRISDLDTRSNCINILARLGDALEPVYGRPIVREAIEIFGEYSAKSDRERSITMKAGRIFHNHPTPYSNGNLESSALSVVRLKNNIGSKEDLDISEILCKYGNSSSALEKANNEVNIPSLHRYTVFRDVLIRCEKIDIIPNEMLSKNIYADIEDGSLSERHRNTRIDLTFNRAVEAFEASLPALKAELVDNLSYVPGDNRRPLQARANLAGTQRPRYDHGR